MFNAFYNSLTYNEKAKFHALFAKRYRTVEANLEGTFVVRFMDRDIRLPLRREHLWLDWDSALSILGHDIEVKQEYERQIAAGCDLFIDVGANYGTHSLLFLSAGIRTISIEPNQQCYKYFKFVSELNGFAGDWRSIALGTEHGAAELSFPPRDTWLGSTDPQTVTRLRAQFDLVTESVEMLPLDAFSFTAERPLIKIDVEGAERTVLAGAKEFIAKHNPTIILESWGEPPPGYRRLGGDNWILEP